jgi:glutamine synthetase
MKGPSFAQRCGVHDTARETACADVMARIEALGIERVRLGWCDVHGMLRGKTLMPRAVARALREGIGMVGTLMLKDTSDRTVWKVFAQGGTDDLPAFAGAANLTLLPDPHSFTVLPWQPRTAWMRCQPWYPDGRPVPLDARHQLQRALERLAGHGLGLRTGLEVEFHVYRIVDDAPQLDPERAAWPGEPPRVRMIHPGYNLQAEAMTDMSDEPLQIVMHTAQALGLPLQSLEIELGPSQVEAVFDATDALSAADQMVLFRNGVRQALRRAGCHATFMCRPPFPQVMASGWHLHHSAYDLAAGANRFRRPTAAGGTHPDDARRILSDEGAHWLGGLLAHAAGMTALCAPTVNAYGRFRPNALAPQSVIWGHDNRGAMLRVVGQPGDAGTRIENRVGEPAANPYLYMAAQVHAGLDGLEQALDPPPACHDPYAPGLPRLPATLDAALDALLADGAMQRGFGMDFLRYFERIKRHEALRHAEAEDATDFERREYFARY